MSRTGLGWKQHFTDVVNTVADQAFRAKDVTYSRILALDKQLRHHPTPAPLRWPSTKGAMYQKLGRTRLTGMQCLGRIILQESSKSIRISGSRLAAYAVLQAFCISTVGFSW